MGWRHPVNMGKEGKICGERLAMESFSTAVPGICVLCTMQSM